MGTIDIDTLTPTESILYSLTIVKRQKSAGQLRREADLDNTFSSDNASTVVYHRSNGTDVNLRGWLREEYFEETNGETSLGDQSTVLRVPSHKFYFRVATGDWIEIEGLTYNVILTKKMMGGTTVILLHEK